MIRLGDDGIGHDRTPFLPVPVPQLLAGGSLPVTPSPRHTATATAPEADPVCSSCLPKHSLAAHAGGVWKECVWASPSMRTRCATSQAGQVTALPTSAAYVMSRPDGLGEVPGQRLPVCQCGVDAEGPSPGCEARERHELPAGEAGQLQWLVGTSGGDRRGAGGGDGLLLARRLQEREVNRTVAWP